MIFTAFKIAIIIASIMGKINLESIYTEYFIRQNRNWKCFHHSQQGKSASPLLYCLSLQNHILLKSKSSLIPHRLLHFWMWLEKIKHNHTGQISLSISDHLTPAGPLMLHSNHCIFFESIRSPILLGYFILSLPTSNIVSPSLYVSWWPCILFHWAMRGNQQRTYKTLLLPLLANSICSNMLCFSSCYYEWTEQFPL